MQTIVTKTNFFKSAISNCQLQIQKIGFKKTMWYFGILVVTLVFLAIAIWGFVTVTVIKQDYLNQLTVLVGDGRLAEVYPDLAKNGVWFEKGIDPYSWYLASIDDLGSVAYWMTCILGLFLVPLLIYYIASFLIVCFPKQPKVKKAKKAKKGGRKHGSK